MDEAFREYEKGSDTARAVDSFYNRAYSLLSSTEARAAFDLKKESPAAPEVYEIDGTFVVAVLAERQEADPAALTTSRKDELRAALLTRLKEEALASRLKDLREKAEISIAPTLLSTLEGNQPS